MPQEPGVYQFLNSDNEVLYVGKAKNLRQRVSSYFVKNLELSQKTYVLVGQVKKIRIIRVDSEIEALLLEAKLIKAYSPKYNIRLIDGKAYPLIRITKKSLYPAVIMARRIEDSTSVYFGPFPSSQAVKSVLRLTRRIFPYHSLLNHPCKICLYHHLGICPCVPAFIQKNIPLKQIKKAPIFKQYAKDIKHLIDFLDGNTKKVIKDLAKERDIFSVREDFESSKKIQKQIDAINLITSPVHTPFEYETNPNLKEDLRMREMQSLQKILRLHNVTISLPRRIECYDNSNIQGTSPTSSLVVLTNGEIDKSQYRKFKIRTVKGPNDFASMQEVLTRRLKHTEWPYPDLIIVDGGKGQVSVAKEILANSKIPIIGLAKREETIITCDFQEIRLSKSDPALQLVMRIRDEAHRFAITYHRKLRSKSTFF